MSEIFTVALVRRRRITLVLRNNELEDAVLCRLEQRRYGGKFAQVVIVIHAMF